MLEFSLAKNINQQTIYKRLRNDLATPEKNIKNFLIQLSLQMQVFIIHILLGGNLLRKIKRSCPDLK